MKKFLFAATAAIMMFASCSENDDVKVPEVIEGEKATLDIAFKMPASMSRTEYITALDYESKVKAITVYSFSSSGDELKVNELSITDFTQDGNYYRNKTPLETAAGLRNLYVGVNMPALTVTTEKELLDAVATLSEAANPTDGFVMFSDCTTKDIHAQDKGTEPVKNTLSTTVRRLVAKVIVTSTGIPFPQKLYNGEGTEAEIKYEVKNWFPGNVNEEIYYVQRIVNGLETPWKWTGTGTSPKSPGKYDAVAVGLQNDPNVCDNGEWKWTSTDLKSYYFGENAGQDKAIASYVMVQTKVSGLPLTTVGYDTKHDALTGKDRPVYTGRTPGTAYVPGSDFFLVFCKETVTGENNNDIWFVSSYDEAYALASELTSKSTTGKQYVFTEYKAGYVYFMVFINTAKGTAPNPPTPGSKDHRNLERNELAHILVTGIKEGVFKGWPGDPTIPDGGDGNGGPGDGPGSKPVDPTDENTIVPDPWDPSEDKETILNIEIQTLPWVYFKNEVILE
ncbi:Mfa1 family fimbria major subunit [Bacteroides sp. 519]|uniref:Mfa1 family fimbria major subunit n=1 Tax=Bacteroides sp. 519 TaxID=2302937 RepID=UPI0013D0E17E|nr:Mfa1 family fimbria major subunit [Bacteroides sp. 519]